MGEMERQDGIDVSVKIRWLLLSRLFISTFLLGIATFIEFQGTEANLNTSVQAVSVYYVIAATYLTSILFIFLNGKFRKQNLWLFLLGASDLVLITILVHYTGGAESVYSIFYSLVVIYAALLIGRNSGYAIAGLGGLLYAILLCSENWGLIRHMEAFPEFNFAIRQLFVKWFVQVTSLFIISFLTSFVADRERRVRELLAEKEDAFKELDILHRHIIESIEAGVLTFDLKGRIKTFNRAASEITGLDLSDVLDRNVYDLFPGIREALRSGEEETATGRRRYETTIPGKGNSKTLIGFSLSRLVNRENRIIGDVLIFQNVTAIKAMQKQIEKNRKMALIGEMAAGLAHEIRNPLAALGGSIQLLQKGLNLNNSDERLMQIILRGKDQLDVLVRDFLMLARPAAQRLEKIDAGELITDVIESIRYGEHRADEVDIMHDGKARGLILGNRSEIRQALMNIIINAIQSMPEGGRLTISQSPYQANGCEYLNISIEDTGYGIDEENIERIFEPFFTTKERGTGLGLAIVSRVLEGHQGFIAVNSRAGQGTKMELFFPAAVQGREDVEET